VPEEPGGNQPRPEDAVKTPAGWYDDPQSPGRRRYWDGSRWTEHYAAGAQQATQPMPGVVPPVQQASAIPKPAPAGGLKWWQKTGGAVGIGIVAGLLGLAIGAGAGASSSDTTTATNTTTTTETSTETVAQTVTQKAKPAPASASSVGSSGGGPSGTQHFSGSGQKNLGTISVPVDSTLSWSCEGCSSTNFIINNARGDDHVIATNGLNQTHGVDPLQAGTYHTVVVDTTGADWTIDIKPG
jgi:hypothetical protein